MNLQRKLIKLHLILILALLFVLSFEIISRADQEDSNRTYVTTSKHGQYYAKSIPYERYGLKGITKVYQVSKNEDILIQTYDWYSPQIYLEGFTGTQEIYVIQMGPWHRGRKASAEHHAMAFYKNDRLLKKYSTLDIASTTNYIDTSVSHYTIFSKILGFRRPYGNQLVFDVETHGGRIHSFDTETGTLITEKEEVIRKQLYEAEVKIEQIKWKWYESNKEKISDINEVLITEEMLKRVAPKYFPDLPNGYRYVPDTKWKRVRFEEKQED